jgi:hypothetical protein
VVIGGILAVSSNKMAQVELNDREPGTTPEMRRIAGGALALLITIAAGRSTRPGDQLILRCEPDGQLFAALIRTPPKSDQL